MISSLVYDPYKCSTKKKPQFFKYEALIGFNIRINFVRFKILFVFLKTRFFLHLGEIFAKKGLLILQILAPARASYDEE